MLAAFVSLYGGRLIVIREANSPGTADRLIWMLCNMQVNKRSPTGNKFGGRAGDFAA